MNFSTPIHITPSSQSLAYSNRILLLGSCFSDHIADKMREYYFQVESNPTGTLYNPISVARHVGDVDFDVALLTFGTAWVYEDVATKVVVDNCRKRPASDFFRRRMTVDEIVDIWFPILQRYSAKRFIFTVSPIRHIKDGLHENQLSKAVLLEAIDCLVSRCPHAQYFPSYEILLDELRDYRYYAADMLHPSQVAVDYIWERFQSAYIWDTSTQEEMKVLHQLWLDSHHRPLCPDSEEYRQFVDQLTQRRMVLRQKYPWL